MKTDFKSKLELVRYYADEESCKSLLAKRGSQAYSQPQKVGSNGKI